MSFVAAVVGRLARRGGLNIILSEVCSATGMFEGDHSCEFGTEQIKRSSVKFFDFKVTFHR